MEAQIRLGACDEERPCRVHGMQTREIHIAAIHDVDRAGFRGQQVEGMNVVQLAVRDMDETGNAAAQVEQRMHLHRCLGRAEMRPGKDRQTKIDGGRVERIHRVRQLQPQVLAGVELSRLDDQTGGKVGMDAPVARFVGVGQRRSSHGFAKSHVVQLGRLRRQTGVSAPGRRPAQPC